MLKLTSLLKNWWRQPIRIVYQYMSCNLSRRSFFCHTSSAFLCFSQESTKVSELNPNAKAWANHMFSLDPSGSADTTTAALQPWKEGCDSSANPGTEGQPNHIQTTPILWDIQQLDKFIVLLSLCICKKVVFNSSVLTMYSERTKVIRRLASH